MNTSEEVIKILQELGGKNEIRPEHFLQNDIGLDSFGLVSMLIALEENFQIELKESDMNPFDFITVSDVVALVERYLRGTNERCG